MKKYAVPDKSIGKWRFITDGDILIQERYRYRWIKTDTMPKEWQWNTKAEATEDHMLEWLYERIYDFRDYSSKL